MSKKGKKKEQKRSMQKGVGEVADIFASVFFVIFVAKVGRGLTGVL